MRGFDSDWLNHHLQRHAVLSPVAATAVEDESKLHYEIMDFCRDRGWQFFHGAMCERTHRTEGEPDFIILANAGQKYLVECKSKNGKLSPAQQAVKHHAERNGHVIHIVHSMSEFLAIFTAPTLSPVALT